MRYRFEVVEQFSVSNESYGAPIAWVDAGGLQ